MSADFLTALLPTITLALGVAGTVFVEFLRDSRSVKREENARSEIRSQERQDRAQAFDMGNLAATYSNLDRYGRAATQRHVLDFEAATTYQMDYASPEHSALPGSNEVSQELLLAGLAARSSSQLILSAAVRDLVTQALDSFTALSGRPKVLSRAANDYDEASHLLECAQQRISESIRSLYEAP